MTPFEVFLLIFMILFLLVAFALIYMILIDFNFGQNPAPPRPIAPTGPNTGNPPSSCSQNYLSDNYNCCVTGVICNTSALQFCVHGQCTCVTGSSLCATAGFGGSPACVFLKSDINNCGKCGRMCSAGEVCCDGECVDVLGSTGSCGGCGNVCSGPNDSCCAGVCVDMNTSVSSCGACFAACAPGQLCCGGGCTGPDNNRACGACGNICPENTVCKNGECVPGCETGFNMCNGVCSDPLTDSLNCNGCRNVCPPGTYCQMGSCTPNTCTQPGEVFCPSVGYCVNVMASSNFCGDCVTQCPHGACVNGYCICATTFDCLGGSTCVHSSSSTAPILPSGATGAPNTTTGPSYCIPPSCPVAGQEWCSNGTSAGSCTSVLIDPSNCGQCGTRCASGQCQNGACTCSDDTQCPAGFVCVGDLCVLR